MPEVGPDALRQVQEALKRYEREVDAAKQAGHLTDSTASTYLRHAGTFLRWLDGRFNPGGGRP